MAHLPLSQGLVAVIDDADLSTVGQFKWSAERKVTAHTAYAKRRVNGRTVYLHRVLMGDPAGMYVDHIDGDGLNNVRANLRVVTKTQNQRNARRRLVGTSQYKGVCRTNRAGIWQAGIRVNNKRLHLGCFSSELDAARAYDAAADRYFGEHACPNFPHPDQAENAWNDRYNGGMPTS